MAKKVLVAVDESKNSMKAVKYVANGIQPTGKDTICQIGRAHV